MTELLTGTSSRPRGALLVQKTATRAARRVLPRSFLNRMGWDGFGGADAVIAITPSEAHLMVDLFERTWRKSAAKCVQLNDQEPLGHASRVSAPGLPDVFAGSCE